MEVRHGYKQTEAGVIPRDWIPTTIGDFAIKVGSGVTPRGGNSNYREYGRPFVRSQNVGWGKLLLSDLVYIDDNTHSGFPSTELRQGDVLLNITGASIGRSAIVDARLVGGNVNQHVCIIRTDPHEVEPRFLSYFLLSRLGQQQIDNFQAGGNREGLNFGQVRSIRIALPPTKAEQEAIVEALSDADSFIESLEQLVAKKRQIKQGAIQELLTGKKRLPGVKINRPYKCTEVGMIPEDWNVAPVGLHLRRKPSYGINAPAAPLDSRLPTYLRITDITDDGRFERTTRVSVEHPAAVTYLLEPGDVVFARTGASVGKSYNYNPEDGDLTFAGFLIRLSPDPERLVPAFLSFYAQSRPYWSWIKVNSMRSGQPGINGREYASLPIPLPPTKAEQESIAEALSDIDAEFIAFEGKLAKARQIKQGMMQELLTGRIRLA